jgi:hypothetical protein
MYMKNKNLILLALTVMAPLATGCGRSYIGTYSGTEVDMENIVSTRDGSATASLAAPLTGNMNLIITQSMGGVLSGVWTSLGQKGTFRGTLNNDEITGVTLDMIGPTNTTLIFPYGPLNEAGDKVSDELPGTTLSALSALCDSFTGKLDISNNKMVGTLVVVSTAQTRAVSTNHICVGSRTVNASKIN